MLTLINNILLNIVPDATQDCIILKLNYWYTFYFNFNAFICCNPVDNVFIKLIDNMINFNFFATKDDLIYSNILYNLYILATSVDSRLQFSAMEPIRYVLLESKQFPSLQNFTIAMWLKVYNHSHPGTVMSYKVQERYNVLRILAGPTLTITLDSTRINTGITLPDSEWVHIAITWNRTDMWYIRRSGSEYSSVVIRVLCADDIDIRHIFVHLGCLIECNVIVYSP